MFQVKYKTTCLFRCTLCIDFFTIIKKRDRIDFTGACSSKLKSLSMNLFQRSFAAQQRNVRYSSSGKLWYAIFC